MDNGLNVGVYENKNNDSSYNTFFQTYAKTYNDICHCQFGDEGFYSLLEFAKDCKESGIQVNFSVVRADGVDVDKTVALADSLQIPIRIRELIK